MRVFVHGVPETSVVWKGLRDELGGSSTALALPGFGTGLPSGFVPTKDRYASWLTDHLRSIREPIDLVGHDWGAMLVLRLATMGEVPLRSWVCDVGGAFHPDYAWHPWAGSLIEPGKGEEVLSRRRQSDPQEAGALMTAGGVPAEDAREMFDALDEVMSQCVLGLYRSAVPNVAADWAARAQVPTAAPGMIVVPAEDRFDDEGMAREVAGRLGARVEVLDGLGHWWMYDGTGRAASVLKDFWASAE